MALGDFLKMSDPERVEWYRRHKCYPTADIHGLALPRTQWLLNEHTQRPFTSFLDIGCHDGFTSRWLLDQPGFNVLIGIDPCIEAITTADRIIAGRPNAKKAVYIALGFEELPMSTQFDGVSFFETIEHFTPPQVKEAILYTHKALRRGGRAYVSTPDINGPVGRTNPDPAHINLFDEARLRAELAAILSETDAEQLTTFSQDGFIYARWERPAVFDVSLLEWR